MVHFVLLRIRFYLKMRLWRRGYEEFIINKINYYYIFDLLKL